MDEKAILERLTGVYQESMDRSPRAAVESSNAIAPPAPNIANIEIDGNYRLYFNDIYRNRSRSILKSILKKLTWSILKRQVFFNTAIREALYRLMQQDYEFHLQTVKSQSRISELEEKVQQLSEQVEELSKLNQQALSALAKATERQVN